MRWQFGIEFQAYSLFLGWTELSQGQILYVGFTNDEPSGSVSESIE
jgi:hypothetical protein